MQIEIGSAGKETVVEISLVEIVMLIAFLVTLGYVISCTCNKRRNLNQAAKQNYYEMTDKVLVQLDEDDRLSQMNQSGPDYVQF